MRPSKVSFARLSTVAFALVAAGLLAGCGGDSNTDAKGAPTEPKSAESNETKGASSGSIQIGDRTITFTPDTCMTSGEETLVSGPGKDADGTPVYVDLDSMSATTGELRVDIGSDKKFASSDEILRAASDGADFSVTPNPEGVNATGVFTDGNNNPIGTGTMVALCQ